MRRLRDFQIALLAVSGTPATCRVVATGGGEAVLTARTPAELAGVALPGPATLSFETASHPVLLAGAAMAGPVAETLAFRITDAVGLRELRLRPRLRAEFHARVTRMRASGVPAGAPLARTTVDLSAGGVTVAGLPAATGDLLAVEIDVPGLPRPLACTARVLRGRPGGTVLTFVDLEPGVAAALDRLIFEVRRRIARRAFVEAADAA